VNRVLGQEDRGGHETASVGAPEIEAVEVLVGVPADPLAQRIALLRRQADFAHEVLLGSGQEVDQGVPVRGQHDRRRNVGRGRDGK
jgi:hypothetical protein